MKQAPHSEQATGQELHCSTRAKEFPRSVNFSIGRTVAELRGVKIAKFSYFGLRGYTSENDSVRSKGVPSGTGDFLRLLLGELSTPKLAQT